MPTVPRVTGRQVETRALPGVRKTAAETELSMGVGLERARAEKWRAIGQAGEQLGRVGGVMAEIVIEERKRANEIANLDAENQLATWESKRVYDPETGALTVRGKASFDLPEKVGAEFEDLANTIEDQLGTDEQRIAFQRVRLQRGRNLDLTLRRHVYGEMQRYEGQELQATIDNAENAAIANATDPRRVGLELGRAIQAIKTHAPRLGLGPEEVTGQVEAVATKVHVGVVASLLAQDQVKAAEVYFEETKGEIVGPALAQIQKALEEGGLRKRVQKKTDEILAKGGTLPDWRKAAKEIDDPKERAGVTEQVEHEAAVQDRLDRDAHEAMVTRGKNTVDRYGDWRRIPATEWAEYTVGEAAAIKAYTEHKVAAIPVKTDPNTYYLLTQLATSGDPELRKQFQQTNLVGFVDKLSLSDLQQFMDAQGKGRKGDEEGSRALLVNAQNQNRMVDEALVSMGMDPTPAQPGAKTFSQKAADRVAQFRRSVREAISRQEQNQAKPATDEQVQSIVDQLRAPTGQRLTAEGWISDTYTQAFAFETAQAKVASVKDVPASERSKIQSALRAKGLPVTDAAILELFNLRLSLTRKDQ